MPSVHHGIPEYICELIPILFSLSPAYINAENFDTIHLGLSVSDVPVANSGFRKWCTLAVNVILKRLFKCR